MHLRVKRKHHGCGALYKSFIRHIIMLLFQSGQTLAYKPLVRDVPSGMCAKLRTMAASNNRDQLTRSLCYCLFAPHTYIFVLRAHPVRGESHNQRNTTGEVATTSPPFHNEPHRSHVRCVKAELGTTSTSWSQHHFVAIGNPKRYVRKASHRGSQQQ